ncbi:MAG: endolytic transglycosylase MltG [Pseudonocardiales bacterium]|nr:endolytic transglycosylase MltG [Pseudonocardiales bacterium]MBV9030563.1 endolytic transglycosylase MltG [Pseudonocardiales bacterium]MBW0010565.1 endolytic transglycosylase MltG [Pseudonocardiales bacterium]
MTDDFGLFRDTVDDAEHPRPRRLTDSRRARRRARERCRRRVVLAAVLAVLVLAVGGVLFGVRKLQELREVPDFVGAGGAQTVVQVEDGQSLTAIGATLARRSVVASIRAFTRAAEADPRIQAVQPGYYQLRERMSGSAAVARLQEPSARVGHLEIRGGEQLDNVELPDGKTVPGLLTEISRASCAMIEGASTCVPPADLRTAMVQTDPGRLAVPGWALDPIARVEPRRRLEGLLVPGVYDVRPGSSAVELLRQVVSTSVARLLAGGFPASAAGTGHSAYEVLVIASVIEREAITPDFRRVSRVIDNRLAAGMPLQMDSTINYPLDRQEVNTSDADRARAGPYNTYLNVGLPASPIGSPSAAAIAAALNPEPGAWRYFVKCQKDGASCFSVTREEHDVAVHDAAARGVF